MENVNELVNQLKVARDFYYKGRPIMDDTTFDLLENKLRSLDPTNTYFNSIGTGAERGVKVKHRIPMGSLKQISTIEEISDWVQSGVDYVISDKLDGNSVAIYYDEDGNFELAVTRGDGEEGLDITRHIKRMLACEIPPIPAKASPNLCVRCEAIFSDKDFESLESTYKNPRNYVAGQLNRTTADQAFIDKCHLIAFDSNISTNKDDMLFKLSHMGFEVTQTLEVMGDFINFNILETELRVAKDRSPYALDGFVIDINDQNTRLQRGFDGLYPNFAVKFKINKDFVETEVVNVDWNVSKDGFLKPRVQFESVELDGATISFATGFNAKFIQDNKIGPGTIIKVCRSGAVIPYIAEVIRGTSPLIPTQDDFGSYHWSETGVDIILDDLPDQSIIMQMVEFFRGIDAPLLKEGNITALYEAGFGSISSIIKADENDLSLVLGENGVKIYLGLRDRLSNGIDEYILAGSTPFFGRGIGKRKIKKLAEKYGEISGLSYEDVLNTDGYDEKTASLVIEGLPLYKDFLNDVKDHVIVNPFVPVSGDLNNIVVCFTGVRSKELEKNIEGRGGKVSSSVSKETTHLVAKNVSGSSGKLEKAKKAGVQIVSIEEAQKLWG